ncbi:MAG TPA: hypothetical protein VHH34_08895 [Pseudonocardiaceae bacterium]|nr:hypothetical protein [Pseudonocardiaceae bacterium]
MQSASPTATTEPAELVAEHNQRDLPEPPASATVVGFGRHDLAELRHLVADHAARAGMATQRLAELVFLISWQVRDRVEFRTGHPGTTMRMHVAAPAPAARTSQPGDGAHRGPMTLVGRVFRLR